MTIAEVARRLTLLGFKMGAVKDVPEWGKRPLTEHFDFRPNHVLTTPYRDVYIGECQGGWYITSHIYFRGRMFRRRKYNVEHMKVRNLFGGGATLAQAFAIFRIEFLANETLSGV